MKKYFAAAALLMMMAACGSAGQDKKLEGTTWKLAKMEAIPAAAVGKEADFFTLEFNAAENGRVPENTSGLPKGEAACGCFLWNAYSLRGVTLTYDLPAPFLQNSTVPSTRAKSVWSLPIPTFSPGL